MDVTAPLDWYAWHAPYDELVSPLTQRLAVIQDHVRHFLDHAPDRGPARPLRVISLAAGQSRDLLPLLIEHPRGPSVHARLVELDPRNADFAEGAALSARLTNVEIVVGDAGRTEAFEGAVPADLILACGLFDTIAAAEIPATIAAFPQLSAPGATLIWTETLPRTLSTAGPDITGLLKEAGFAPVSLALSPGEALSEEALSEEALSGKAASVKAAPEFTVGVACLTGPAEPLKPGTRMFHLA